MVACSFVASSVTRAAAVLPADFTTTLSNSISAAFKTMSDDGFFSVTTIRSVQEKVAAGS